MRVTISKSKNSESFYITKSYVDADGRSTSRIVRKLGTLEGLSQTLGTNREGVLAWEKQQAKLETEKYKQENEEKTVQITFHADREMEYDRQKEFCGAISFPSIFTINCGWTMFAGG